MIDYLEDYICLIHQLILQWCNGYRARSHCSW